jgi:hypothetical protein
MDECYSTNPQGQPEASDPLEVQQRSLGDGGKRRRKRRTDSYQLHRVHHGILSREVLAALAHLGEEPKTYRRLERQFRAALHPSPPWGDLFFDRLWSSFLRLMLIGRMETRLLSARPKSSETSSSVSVLLPGPKPTLVLSSDLSGSSAEVTLEELPTDLLRQLVLAERYDAHYSREMYRALALLLLLRQGGETALEVWAAEMLGAQQSTSTSIEEERTVNNQQLNILDFIRSPELLNDQSLSLAQRACLKTIYGLPLDGEELEVYRRAAGRADYMPQEYNEATLIVGRRGGKTSKIAAPIACYEAFRDHQLSRGERGYVVLLAPRTYQAKIAFRFIRSYLENSPVLAKWIKKIRKQEIDLHNDITIGCYPCNYVAVRGISIVAAICDELGFWWVEETAANPDEEVLAALRPAMATFPTAKLIKISTPYRKDGVLWREFQQRADLGFPVWQLSTFEMNPRVKPEQLESERRRSEEHYRREYLAEFTDEIASWISPEVLHPCVVQDRTELPPVEEGTYVAAVDPAFQRNDFALAVVHKVKDEPVVLDRVARWAGTKNAPLGYEWVCNEVVQIVNEYGINCVLGDQYCAPVIKQYLSKLGIAYQDFTFGSHTRADLFGNLKHLLVQRRIELLDDPLLLRQLRALEEQKTPRGDIDIRPGHNQKDDIAVAVALAAFELSKQPQPIEPWVRVISFPVRCSALGNNPLRGPDGITWHRIFP